MGLTEQVVKTVDQKLRKVVKGTDKIPEVDVMEEIKKEQRDALNRGKDCAKGSELKVFPNVEPIIQVPYYFIKVKAPVIPVLFLSVTL